MIKRPSQCTILVVDDEVMIGELLKSILGSKYNVTVCESGAEAFSLIETNDFDVVITDLKLPDASGMDIASFAKTRDEHTEIIVITGFPSIPVAASAINLGVASFLTKPIDFTYLEIQVEKAIASRLFHLKSLELLRQTDFMAPEIKGHICDITSLYFFTRKLMLSLEISEIMKITLDEVNCRMKAAFCAIGIVLRGYSEIYAMPLEGEISDRDIRKLFCEQWGSLFQIIDKTAFEEGKIPLIMFKGKHGTSISIDKEQGIHVPMMVSGRLIGTLAVFGSKLHETDTDSDQFLEVMTSIAAPVIEHAYADRDALRQAKTDNLTGIGNHRAFHEALDREIARADRRDHTFSLAIIDIDDFKKVNDSYGHQIGDAVLQDLTTKISKMIRAGDIFTRFGGEEFGLILPDTNEKGASVLAKRICRAVASQTFTTPHVTIRYTISIGVTTYEGASPVTKDIIITQADKALYTSKHLGKNRISVCNEKR